MVINPKIFEKQRKIALLQRNGKKQLQNMIKQMKKSPIHIFDINNLLIFAILSIKASIFFGKFSNAFIEFIKKQFSKISNQTMFINKTVFPTNLYFIPHLKYFLHHQSLKTIKNIYLQPPTLFPLTTQLKPLTRFKQEVNRKILKPMLIFINSLRYIHNSLSSYIIIKQIKLNMYFNFVPVPQLYYLQQQPYQIYSIYESPPQITQEHSLLRNSDFLHMEQKPPISTTYETLDLENKEGYQKTIAPSSPIALPQKNIRQKRKPSKILQSAKKNSENNIIKQFFNNICIRRNSQKLLVKIIQRSKIASIPAQKLLNFIYSLVFYIKEENKRKYMNTNGLLYQLSHEAIYQYTQHLKNTLENNAIDIQELSEGISSILLIFLRNYLKNVCPLAILTSKRIIQNAKYYHLLRQREILQQMSPINKQQ